jgi:two-component system phosphate regulon response regulator PhoB
MPDATGNLAKPVILIVEDEAPLLTLLRYNLEKQGFRVEEAADGQEALLRVAETKPDLVLLDWMLPALSGLEVCRQIRRRPATRDLPIIMVTARTEDQDAVRALDTGADDYIAKPYAMEALLARIRALLRRSGAVPVKGRLSWQDIVMDQDAHRVTRCSRALHLGPTEYRLLEFFLQHPGRVFSREQLLDAVWGRDIHVEPRTVDVHIRRLRKAVNGDGEMDAIRTVTGIDFTPEIGPRRPGDPDRIVATGEADARDLDWANRHTLEEMVRTAWQARTAH